ncbi:Hypothetical_protein [Hexamita inflata]|uniref:Hypothetical_protein n=1 Tax=Hexamita inflata TaxID=28002 RepID=A0AA86NH10_9EUKA|nr:Hypothetical protein HINF_LOCUS6952 [Hexamita inflata]
MNFSRLQSSFNSLQLKHQQSHSLLQNAQKHQDCNLLEEADSITYCIKKSLSTFHDQLQSDFSFKGFKDRFDLEISASDEVDVVMDEESDQVPFSQFKIGALHSLFE